MDKYIHISVNIVTGWRGVLGSVVIGLRRHFGDQLQGAYFLRIYLAPAEPFHIRLMYRLLHRIVLSFSTAQVFQRSRVTLARTTGLSSGQGFSLKRIILQGNAASLL